MPPNHLWMYWKPRDECGVNAWSGVDATLLVRFSRRSGELDRKIAQEYIHGTNSGAARSRDASVYRSELKFGSRRFQDVRSETETGAG